MREGSIQDAGIWMLDSGFLILDAWFSIPDLEAEGCFNFFPEVASERRASF
jgi:hypothetical protein